MKLLMISGRGATETARGKRNAFYNTLEELHKYFESIDVVCEANAMLFGNVFFHSEVPDKKFDVMTVHEYFPFRNGRLAAKIWKATRTPYLLEIHHVPGYPRAASAREWIACAATRLYIAHDARHATAVRVVNQQQAPEFLIRAGVPAEKIKYIPSMYIDTEIFKPMNLEKKYDLIFVGRRAKNKGVELFEKAGRGFKTLIVDGWAKDSQELAKLYNESRLLIVPSYNEGGPRVMLEALACSTPVLCTRVGLAPELLPEDLLIDWSVDDIVAKTQRVLAGEVHVDGPAIAARFEKKAMIANYAEFLQHALSPKRRTQSS
ncbi:MAG: glycosyltransferase [Patescibacteria group bacterium]